MPLRAPVSGRVALANTALARRIAEKFPMKLQAQRLEGQNAISRHSVHGVVVNGVEHRHSVVVAWSGDVQPWGPGALQELTPAHFERLVALAPDLIIFGSGARLQFPPPALLRPLMRARIGLETMDTPAACRTYNVLLAEGRSVVAALLFDPPSDAPAPR
jgi:uncharacterized protein